MFKSKYRFPYKEMKTDLESVQDAIKMGHVCPVDQFGVQDFGRNDAGWPRNTISLLERCQTLEQYKLLASRLVETPIKSDNQKGLTLKQRFAFIRPRYAQTPLECEALAEVLAQYDMNAINTQVDSMKQKAADDAVKAAAAAAPSPTSASAAQ